METKTTKKYYDHCQLDRQLMVHTYYEFLLHFMRRRRVLMDVFCCLGGERHLLEFFSEVDNFFLSSFFSFSFLLLFGYSSYSLLLILLYFEQFPNLHQLSPPNYHTHALFSVLCHLFIHLCFVSNIVSFSCVFGFNGK